MSKKNDEKKSEKKHGKIDDLLDLVRNFFKLQNQYNHFRIEEYKEWNDTVCECPICVDYTVQTCDDEEPKFCNCLLYTSPSPRDKRQSRMPSSA